MKVTGLAIVPPPAVEGQRPRVTPELLASCLAKYSRSNKGIEAILETIDWENPDAAVERIFRFVDYGHASIGGLTGGIAMAVDGCSMLLAYKIFEIAQLCDGQESSTRYIRLAPESLPAPDAVGIPAELADTWADVMGRAFGLYSELYEQLDAAAQADPSLVRVPEGAGPKVVDRLRKNYALDRARYLIPFATRSNAAYVMSARVWAETIRRLDALAWPEARHCAAMMREELERFAPRLIRHSHRDEASVTHAGAEDAWRRGFIAEHGVATHNLPDEVFVAVEDSTPPFLRHLGGLDAAFAGKANRYSIVGERIRRQMVRFAWNNMALAELRDLNRHRSGNRFTPLTPVGFYLPEGVTHPELPRLLEDMAGLVRQLAAHPEANGCELYGYLLGVQTPFEHSTHADKFIYEVELRTGLGAHFRYAEHLAAVCREFLRQRPDFEPHIQIGTAEPE